MRTIPLLALVTIATSAIAFDITAESSLIRPPILFAVEAGFFLAWGVVYGWNYRRGTASHWIALATGLATIFGPLRWVLFSWCLLVERCIA